MHEMSSDKQVLVQGLWEDLLNYELDVDEFCAHVLKDCGHDGVRLRVADIVALWYGTFQGDWQSIGFAFDESMASYLCSSLTKEEFVRAMFVGLCLADAARHGQENYFNFDHILKVVAKNMKHADEDFRLRFFRELLRSYSGPRGE